jgi:DNA repair protein RadC
VKALAPQDRPREKLERAGVASLGDNELVALLLGAGVRARSALTVAQDVLDRAGGVRGLARIGADELRRVSGVGGPRAARLLAAVELGRRVIRSELGERPHLSCAKDLAEYLMPIYAAHREERVGVVMLDIKRRVIRTEVLSVGTLDSSIRARSFARRRSPPPGRSRSFTTIRPAIRGPASTMSRSRGSSSPPAR